MKNLFSIKLSDKDAAELDESPYLAATASPEVRAKMRNAFSIVEEATAPKEPTEEEKQLRAQGNRYWTVCLVSLAATLILFFVGGDLGIYTAVPALYTVNIGILAVAIVFIFFFTNRNFDNWLFYFDFFKYDIIVVIHIVNHRKINANILPIFCIFKHCAKHFQFR